MTFWRAMVGDGAIAMQLTLALRRGSPGNGEPSKGADRGAVSDVELLTPNALGVRHLAAERRGTSARPLSPVRVQ